MIWYLAAICMLLGVPAGIGGFFYWRSRIRIATGGGPGDDLTRSWLGTVTGRTETSETLSKGPHAGRTVRVLTVYWRQDDGTIGSCFAHEFDALVETYVGQRSYLREAPRYAELFSWNEGARLYKAAGRYFPALAPS